MYKISESEKIDIILPLLPQKIQEEVKKLISRGEIRNLNEIRLRANSLQSFTISGRNVDIKNVSLSEKDIADTVYKLCSGSVYAHLQELKCGYISSYGIRIGVCGKTLYGEGGICGFSSYTSLNIRIPCHIPDAADKLLDYISERSENEVGGILIISPPCAGKTTFLRAFAASLSKGYHQKGIFQKKRVCIIDEREEIALPGVFDGGYADILSAYPKIEGIEICTRVMSPEYIVCDEIANMNDADAICDSASKGVIFASSCHGETFEDVIRKKSIKRLFDERVFKTVCEISVSGEKRSIRVRSVAL